MTDRRLQAVEIRPAVAADVGQLVGLFSALGYEIDAGVLAARLAAFHEEGEVALVAASANGVGDRDRLLGVATLHATPVLHRAGPVGRVTALVVAPEARGSGIGRALMAAAERWAVQRGCVVFEVTSNLRRADAHAFYERVGYTATSYRFGKDLHGEEDRAPQTADHTLGAGGDGAAEIAAAFDKTRS